MSAILLNECINDIMFYYINYPEFVLTVWVVAFFTKNNSFVAKLGDQNSNVYQSHRKKLKKFVPYKKCKVEIILKLLMSMPVEVFFKGCENVLKYFLEFNEHPNLTKNHVINLCENRTISRFRLGDFTWGNFYGSLLKLSVAFVLENFCDFF